MTLEELEEATNPFAAAVDTNGDGEITAEELDDAVDELAKLEKPKEMTIQEMVRAGENKTKVVVEENHAPVLQPQTIKKEVVDTTGIPTRKKLMAKFPVSSDTANVSHKNDWGFECKKWADINNHHFLGFCMKTDEPLFKEKK